MRLAPPPPDTHKGCHYISQFPLTTLPPLNTARGARWRTWGGAPPKVGTAFIVPRTRLLHSRVEEGRVVGVRGTTCHARSKKCRGERDEGREAMVIGFGDGGDIVEEQYTYTVELVSKARRIRYWRHFFAEKVSELWACLFAELEQESVEQADSDMLTRVISDDEMGQEESGKSSKIEPQPIKRSFWSLMEQESLTQDVKEYRRRRRRVLLEALVDIRAGQRSLS